MIHLIYLIKLYQVNLKIAKIKWQRSWIERDKREIKYQRKKVGLQYGLYFIVLLIITMSTVIVLKL